MSSPSLKIFENIFRLGLWLLYIVKSTVNVELVLQLFTGQILQVMAMRKEHGSMAAFFVNTLNEDYQWFNSCFYG